MCLNETYSKVHRGKHLSDNFPIQNALKQGDALTPLLFSLVLEYTRTIRKVQENQMGLKLNGAYQLLVSADDVNLLGDNTEIIKKNTETLMHTSKDVGVEVNAEKDEYILLSRHQNAGQNYNIKIANLFVQNVAQPKYLGKTAIKQNLIHEGIKRRLNSCNACYHSIENLFLSAV
jgi:hypothetical protein